VTQRITHILDSILLRKRFGIIIFVIIIFGIFQMTFGLGYYPMLWIESLISLIEKIINLNLPDSIFKSFLTDGILKGVGGVIIFLPNIIILFTLLSMIEETNYITRVVYIMDRIMHPFGLNGRSFVSLFMGFGCNVPAIMIADKIKNRNTRIITILINHLIPCSSRFTVYVLFISAFFPKRPGVVLFGVYAFTVTIALLTALVMKKFIFKKTHDIHDIQLNEYRLPSLKKMMKTMWFNTNLFLKKISGAVLVASIIIWFLSYFPKEARNNDLEKSYISVIGKAIEPVFRPLGFDWKMSTSLLTGVAAKETIVGTLSELYQAKPHENYDKSSFIRSLQQNRAISPLIAISFIVFVSLYTPCIATITIIRKTTKSNLMTLFIICYSFALAWIFSFAVYQIGLLFF
jgi:ferrous iron transport protein B